MTFDTTFDPNIEFDGVWTKYYEGKDYIPIGSTLLYNGEWYASSAPYGPTMVRQAYRKDLLAGCFSSDIIANTDQGIPTAKDIPTPPDGYKLQIQFSAAMGTGGGNEARIRINGINIMRNLSWGADSFRPVVKSRFFDLDEITTASLKQYGGSYAGQGLCLLFQNALPSGAGSNWCRISEVTGHGYFTSINDCCKWRRTA